MTPLVAFGIFLVVLAIGVIAARRFDRRSGVETHDPHDLGPPDPHDELWLQLAEQRRLELSANRQESMSVARERALQEESVELLRAIAVKLGATSQSDENKR